MLTDAKLKEWTSWIWTNLHRGVSPSMLKAEMAKQLVPDSEIARVFDRALESTAPVDYAALANCSITRKFTETAGLKKIASRKAQVFSWENFLTPDECEKTIDVINQHLRP